MKNYNKVTIILITYKSEDIIFDFIAKIPKNLKTIVVENSNNYRLKNKIENDY